MLVLLLAAGRLAAAGDGTTPPSRRLDPKSEAAAVARAHALIRSNQPFQALIELNDLLEVSPDAVSALKLYAELLEAVLDNRPKAEELIERCMKLAPSDPEVWRDAGNLYLNDWKTPQAIRSFEEAVRLSPRDPALLTGLAMSYGQANSLERAYAVFTQALEITERATRPNPLVYVSYAEFLLDQNRAAESVPYFARALSIDPRFADAYYGRAKAHEKLRKWRQAEADALAAIDRSPQRKDAHLLLVRVYRSMPDPARAEKQLHAVQQLVEQERARQELARRSSEALRLYFEVVEPLLRDGKYEEAIKQCLEIVDLWPEFPAPHFVLGVGYSQIRQPGQAVTFFHKYLSLRPDSADGHGALGMLFLQQDRRQEALRELEQAVSLDPGLLEARKALASLHLSGANFAAAVEALRAAEASTLDNEARLILAEALFGARELLLARRQVELVLQSEPANASAGRLKRLMQEQTR